MSSISEPRRVVLYSDFLGVFDREEGFVVRLKQPGRTPLEGAIEPEDIPAFTGRIKVAQAQGREGDNMDVSMLGPLIEVE